MWIYTWIYLERRLSHAHANIIYIDINTHKSTKELFHFLTSWRISKISFLFYFTRSLLQYWPSHVKCFIRSICTFPATHPSWTELLSWLGQKQQLRPHAEAPSPCDDGRQGGMEEDVCERERGIWGDYGCYCSTVLFLSCVTQLWSVQSSAGASLPSLPHLHQSALAAASLCYLNAGASI